MAPRRHHSEGSRADADRYNPEEDYGGRPRTRREDRSREEGSRMEQMVSLFRRMERNSRRGMEQIAAAVLGRDTAGGRREHTPPEILPPPPVVQEGRDPWMTKMKDSGLQRFDGGGDVLTGRRWMKKLSKTFTIHRIPETERVRLAVYYLEGEAEDWWDGVNNMELGGREMDDISWAEFVAVFNKKYFPSETERMLARQFAVLEQGDKTVGEYTTEFYRLEEFHGPWTSEGHRVDQYVAGLNEDLRRTILGGECYELKSVAYRAQQLEAHDKGSHRGGNSFRPPPVSRQTSYRTPYSSGSSSSGKRKRMDSGSYAGGYSGTGSGGSERESVGSRSCYSCGQTGHLIAHCPSQNRKPPRCFSCGEVGHMASYCPSRGKTPVSEFKCYNCGKSGHTARECPERPKRAGDAPGQLNKGRVFSIMAPDAGPSGNDVVEGE